MSKRIVVLSSEIANKIAAGEVVERPASIVKELVENSIDAGATDIRVELEKGGCQSIKVIDNGSGIEHDDVPLVFERHATSKIHHFEDIFNVISFGFRGEAMPSIASIARVELLTRRKQDLSGTKATLEAGKIKEVAPAGCPEGTQISVTKIFANVPARRKFLKTEATEQGACLDAITRLALAHPEVRFKVLVNGREVLVAPDVQDIAQRITMVIGDDFAAHCLTVEAQKENLSLTGFISRPEYTKSNSKSVYLFVNKRFVRDNSVLHAVLSSYRQIIEPRRYPAAVLFLEMPPEDVDVNVHPAKLEVRFKDAHSVFDLVSKTIARSLAGAPASKGSFIYRLESKEKNNYSFPTPSVQEKSPSVPFGMYSRRNLQQAINNDLLKRPVMEKTNFSIDDDQVSPDEKISFTAMRYVGQYVNTYLIFEGEGGLVLLDQHAAHERIILEKLKQSAGEKVISQSLLMPEIVNLTPGQIALMNDYLDFFQEIGLEIEIFGRDAIAVKAVPVILSQVKISEMISDIADQLSDQNQMPSLRERREKILASLACRAAIKANRVLSREEVAALCRDLEATPFNLTCPHGRPITINFSLSEIERMFKRK
ncbi:MAG TPA: DNA mismatch repair endonuclease MutL [Smithella sp.]|nr:DNA mismatch repair endonuclease MutL [Smithella sp.]HNY50019.1 DNA mismatch repair endonuclease MutL [Smithella sp.]HOG89776.1 DNA mismatch repair endonuclease MutL [Smithella sp.]HQG65301.1 DNA mismatch repair endonuclease MutL [Smithella sp.]HQH16616.1 DNA mismatch repair endonuclease MutL [Smithella sp.]